MAHRYVEQTIHQAMILKLARIVSGLDAARCLSRNGFVQEQAVLQRTIDDFVEDILFLAVYEETSTLHQRVLVAFWQEEYADSADPVGTRIKRENPLRKKIRAHLVNKLPTELSASEAVDTSEALHKMYSGFVHGAAGHILDLFVGEPPRFHVRGVIGSIRATEHRGDLWHQFYRGICAFEVAAKLFGDGPLAGGINLFRKNFAKDAGEDYSVRPTASRGR